MTSKVENVGTQCVLALFIRQENELLGLFRRGIHFVYNTCSGKWLKCPYRQNFYFSIWSHISEKKMLRFGCTIWLWAVCWWFSTRTSFAVTLVCTRNFFFWTCCMHDNFFLGVGDFFSAPWTCFNSFIQQSSCAWIWFLYKYACRLFKNHPPTKLKVKWSPPKLLEHGEVLLIPLEQCQKKNKKLPNCNLLLLALILSTAHFSFVYLSSHRRGTFTKAFNKVLLLSKKT